MRVQETVCVVSRGDMTGVAETPCIWKAGGLAVTQWLGTASMLDLDGERVDSTEGKYVVTHLNTGGSVYRWHLPEAEAIALAETLVTMAPWETLTLTDMVHGPRRKAEWAARVGKYLAEFHQSRTPTTEASPA